MKSNSITLYTVSHFLITQFTHTLTRFTPPPQKKNQERKGKNSQFHSLKFIPDFVWFTSFLFRCNFLILSDRRIFIQLEHAHVLSMNVLHLRGPHIALHIWQKACNCFILNVNMLALHLKRMILTYLSISEDEQRKKWLSELSMYPLDSSCRFTRHKQSMR